MPNIFKKLICLELLHDLKISKNKTTDFEKHFDEVLIVRYNFTKNMIYQQFYRQTGTKDFYEYLLNKVV